MLNISRRARKRQNTCWDASDYCVLWDIPCHNGIGANCDIVANPDAAEDLGSGPNENAVANYWHACPFTTISLSDGDALRDITVLADLGLRVNNNPSPMPNVKPTSNLSLMGNFNAILDGAATEYQPCGVIQRNST